MLIVLLKGLLAGIIVGFVTGLAVNRLWTEKLNRIVAMVVSPLLILVGIRFVLMAWR